MTALFSNVSWSLLVRSEVSGLFRTRNFEHFETEDKPQSLSVSEIMDSKKRFNLNV